jgi:hypothetical protein
MNEEPWTHDEVYQMSPDTLLSSLEGVNNVKLKVLNRAHFIKCRDILDRDIDAIDAAIRAAIDELRREDPGVDEKRWTKRHALALKVAQRIKSAEASPLYPPHLTCSLKNTLDDDEELFIDPVVTSAGQTYERCVLHDWLQKAPTNPPNDPFTGLPLKPLRDSCNGVDKYYVTNVAMKDAVQYYQRHFMRFNLLLKK